jgi:hypothetical protein
MTVMGTKAIIDHTFKEPGIKYELTEFESLRKPIHEILTIYPKTAETGRDAGKTKYYLKSFLPYPKEFDNTLFDVPKRGQQPKDVLATHKTLLQLKKEFNFKEIIQGLEELVLADSGKDEFNDIFKLIFAKIWDEKQAQEVRKDKTVEFGQVVNPKTSVPDPELTYDRVNSLFKKACEGWPGILKADDDIELIKRHLQICVRIRPHSIDPVYLAAFLNTKAGQPQIELHARRSSGQIHLYPRDVSKILVWKAPQSLQTEVRRLIEEAHEAERTARELLDQARTRVEQLIEEAVRS